MTPLVASARMYAVAPGAAAAWRALLNEIARRAGVPLAVVDHAYPATLADLWSRSDLGCAFMCGWPLARENERRNASGAFRPILAAPVPDASWSNGEPVYRADFVAAARTPCRDLADAMGGRFAFNALDSHSGANMPRAHLARSGLGGPHFASFLGPLTTPRRCLEAVVEGRADLTAVDSYALQLIGRHDPALAAAVRVIASSDTSPIPPLVGAPGLERDAVRRLRLALTGLSGDAAGRDLLADLCLLGFVEVDRALYRATLAVEKRASGVPFATAETPSDGGPH